MKLLLLVLFFLEVHSLPENAEKYVEKKTEWLHKEYKELIRKLDTALENAQHQVHEEIAKAEGNIKGQFDAAAQSLDVVAECKSPALDSLNRLKDSFIMRLLNCPKLQDALNDLGAMVYASRDLVEGLVGSVTGLVKGYLECLHHPLTAIFCVTKQTAESVKLALEDTELVFKFVRSVAVLTANATETIYHCLADNDPSGQISFILDEANQCQASLHN